MNNATGGWFARVSTAVVWVLVLTAALAPIAFLVLVSLSRQSDILGGGVVPSTLTLQNWPAAFRAIDVTQFLVNSLAAATLGAAVCLLIAVPGAYSMARYELAGGRLSGLVVGTYIAPPVVAIFPLFYLLRALDLTNSIPGLALVYGLANVPVGVWLLEGFVRRLPGELEEAAEIDGANTFQILTRVILPLLAPGIVATGILIFILNYNEFLLARFFVTRTDTQTMPIAISLFQGDRQVQFGQMAAVSLAALIPVYALAVFFQRWLVEGLTHGGGK